MRIISSFRTRVASNDVPPLSISASNDENWQWLFPDSAEGERKFLVRTDFGGGGDSRRGRRRSSSRTRQGAGDDSAVPPPSSSSREDRKRLYLLVELTCTVQTAKDGEGAAGGVGRGGDGAVRGPLKNFRAGSGSAGGGRGRGRDRKRRGRRRRVGGIRGKAGSDEDGDSDSSYSGGSSSDDGSSGGSQVRRPCFVEGDEVERIQEGCRARSPLQCAAQAEEA